MLGAILGSTDIGKLPYKDCERLMMGIYKDLIFRSSQGSGVRRLAIALWGKLSVHRATKLPHRQPCKPTVGNLKSLRAQLQTA